MRGRQTSINRLSLALVAIAFLTGIFLGLEDRKAHAAELVMFEAKGCTVCRQFNKDAGKEYAKSAAAKVLPLRRIDLHDDKIDVKLKLPVTMTPTFVFVKDGREVTRFVGYPGRKFFFQIVNTAADELSK